MKCFSDLVEYDFMHQWFDWNGLRIHFVDAGLKSGDRSWSGETFLFVHGNPSWSFLFRKVMHQLAVRHRVIAIDLIGFGMSDKLAFEPHSIKTQVDMLATFCTQLKLKDVTLVLHDWGALIGLSALDQIQSPAFLKNLVLLDAFLPSRVSLGHEADFSASLMLMNLQMYTAMFGKYTFIEPLIRFITPSSPTIVVRGYTAPYPSSILSLVFETFPRLIHPMLPRRLTPFFAILFPELADGLHSDEDIHARVDEIKSRLKAMKQPVLVVYGAQDQITLYFKDKWKKLLSRVSMERCDDVVMIHNAGHFSPEDNPDAVTSVLQSFVSCQSIKFTDDVRMA
jgi:haloalkane dehalogenase